VQAEFSDPRDHSGDINDLMPKGIVVTA